MNLLFFLLFLLFHWSNASEAEYRLIKDLKENYSPIERPVKNHSDAVDMKIRVILQQVVDVDEKNQLVTLVVWLQMTWNDYKFKWDPVEYDGITSIHLPPGTLWKPDILLFNSADEHFDALFPVNYVVDYNGTVLLAPPSIVKISCNIDMTHFPFDDQLCHLKYGSWTYDGGKLDLKIDSSGLTKENQMDLQYYVPNGEWELLSSPGERVVKEFAGEKYVELFFYVHLKRRTLYYGLNWIIPSLLISLTNVLGFTLPPECGEKVTVQITNLLSVLVFLGMVSSITPPTSDSIPVIVVFFSASLLILGLSVISTVLIISIHFRSPKTHEMGPWISKVFLEWLPWLLLMKRPGQKFGRPYKKGQLMKSCIGKYEDDNSVNSDSSKESQLQSILKGSEEERKCGKIEFASHPRLVTSNSVDLPQESRAVEDTLQEILKDLNYFRDHLDEEEEEQDLQSDWKFMAMALDRFFLFLFTGLYIYIIVLMVLLTPGVFVTKSIITE